MRSPRLCHLYKQSATASGPTQIRWAKTPGILYGKSLFSTLKYQILYANTSPSQIVYVRAYSTNGNDVIDTENTNSDMTRSFPHPSATELPLSEQKYILVQDAESA